MRYPLCLPKILLRESVSGQSDPGSVVCPREETEIIEGEVVEIQIDRPATGTVSLSLNTSYITHIHGQATSSQRAGCPRAEVDFLVK